MVVYLLAKHSWHNRLHVLSQKIMTLMMAMIMIIMMMVMLMMVMMLTKLQSHPVVTPVDVYSWMSIRGIIIIIIIIIIIRTS